MRDLIATPGRGPILKFEPDGSARMISHDGSEEIFGGIQNPGRMSIEEISSVCGALLHGRYIDALMPKHQMARVVDVNDIPIGILPKDRIIKMMKSDHAELLTTKGSLRLGSIDYYRKHENPEVRDTNEGHCILVGYDGQMTHIRMLRGGLNDRILCCYAGHPDPDIIKRFGYDAAVEITDPIAFADIISKELNAPSSHFSKCVYVRDRVIFGAVKNPIDPQDMMDGRFSEMLGEPRAFLKSIKYRHQSEFRFVWRGQGHIQDCLDVANVALTKHCKRVAFP